MANKVYWGIEISYLHDGEVKRHFNRNCDWDFVKRLQDNIFFIGLRVPVTSDHFIIVSPWNIRSIDIWRQSHFFKE